MASAIYIKVFILAFFIVIVMASRRPDYFKRKVESENWSHEEINRKILSIRKLNYRIISIISFFTLARANEVCLLKWGDIRVKIYNDEMIFLFTLLVEHRRGNEGRKLYAQIPLVPSKEGEFQPLLDELFRFLVQRRLQPPSPEDYVFGDPGVILKPIILRSGNPSFYFSSKLAKRYSRYMSTIENISATQFRYARASYLAHKKKVSLFALRAFGRWKDWKTPMYYVGNPSVEELIRVL